MYAVINTGGKQYRVAAGEILRIEKLSGELGEKIKFNEVLLVSNASGENPTVAIGAPLLDGAVVEAQLLGQGRGEKLTIVKMKRRKQYRRVQGHRQELTEVLITRIQSGTGLDAELSSADIEKTSNAFHSRLKERGLPSTPKTLGSRKRMQNAERAERLEESTGVKAAPKSSPKKTVGAKKTVVKRSAKPAAKKAK